MNIGLPEELEIQSFRNVTQLQQKELTSLFSGQLIELVCDLSGNTVAEVGVYDRLLLQQQANLFRRNNISKNLPCLGSKLLENALGILLLQGLQLFSDIFKIRIFAGNLLPGSRIQLESQLGKGSKFWFDIVFEVSTNELTGVTGETVLNEEEYNSLGNRQILVVEDNKINQMITRKILEKRKIVCQVADNGMDAIKLIQENNFDVVLMDIHMPGISGIEATQEIRKFNPELPIIALTAVTIDENLDEFYRVGFNEIIPKPFKTEEFFEKIHRTLEQSSATTEV